LLLVLGQAGLYLAYSYAPVHFAFLFIEGETTWIRVANIAFIYLALVLLQFKTLRRFSQSLKFGMAL
jgi:hypothetical protein